MLSLVKLHSKLAHAYFNKIYIIDDFGDLGEDCGIAFLALLDVHLVFLEDLIVGLLLGILIWLNAALFQVLQPHLMVVEVAPDGLQAGVTGA